MIAADDWPQWRHDSNRSASSAELLPEDLQPIWTLSLGPRVPAWDDPLNRDLMTYDRVFEPIVMDGRLFVGFNDQDKVCAYDANSGELLWTFFANGPVRLPPSGWNGRIYVCSDDGFLYCLQAETGSLVWKFQGAPSAQQAIGNRRLVSAWPARGGPVVRDGTVYFAASIWPFMGTFIYALDAETGEVRWRNDGLGAHYLKQPHSAPSFAGVAPQGALVATADTLLIPGGRSVPAALNRKDGILRYFKINDGGKGNGGSLVVANDKHYYVHTRLKGTRAFHLDSGIKTAFTTGEPVLDGDQIFAAEGESDDLRVSAFSVDHRRLWSLEADGSGDLIRSGNHLYAGGATGFASIRIPTRKGGRPSVSAHYPVKGGVERLLTGHQKLFAVTLEGEIHAYGGPTPSVSRPSRHKIPEQAAATDLESLHAALQHGEAQGYALCFGAPEPAFLDALLAASPFVQVAIVDPEEETVTQIRTKLDSFGRYGRVTAHPASYDSFQAPDFVAHVVLVSPKLTSGISDRLLRKFYRSVRPFGGVLVLRGASDVLALKDRIGNLALEQAQVEVDRNHVIVRRVGALPGSADWTHQYGNVANTVKSDDARVKLPLGILWFGGNSHMDVLPRHGHGPPEQVIGGRLFIQGINRLSCRDVYTGRVLWKRDFEDLGTYDVYYDKTYFDAPLDTRYNQVHIPGANGRGTNFVATEDRLYLVEGAFCHVLDPGTGKSLRKIQIPATKEGDQHEWGFIGVYQDVLIGGRGFANYRARQDLRFPSDRNLSDKKAGFGSKSLDRAASLELVGFDRHSGKVLWRQEARHSFWHNGIVAGGGRIYCLDKNPTQVEDALRRRGKSLPETYRLLSLDAVTGEMVWEVDRDIFGTWLGYSEAHDLLLQAGAAASDRLSVEVSAGMAVYQGETGRLRWRRDDLKYAGPCILHHDLIITNANSYRASSGAFSLLTGEQKMVPHPITGEAIPWHLERAYGCNNIVASEHLLTFRSGAAGFYDLESGSGTGNFGGFKSGCTSNLVVANGVLNAPDYTRTCSCAYQNQTSLALVHMPGLEYWTNDHHASQLTPGSQIKKLGFNFGAPGDRRDEEGMLWMEHPVVAGSSPELGLTVSPPLQVFRSHSTAVNHREDFSWILSSGLEGVTELRLPLGGQLSTEATTTFPVRHPHDDAEEDPTGKVNLSSSDLELVDESRRQLVGLRFEQISLPRNADVEEAWIQFTSDETNRRDTQLVILAEDSGNAQRYLDRPKNLSHRSRIDDKVAWNPPPWPKTGEAGKAQRTPDLSPLLTRILKHPDWEPGNAVAFLIEGRGKRVAESSKGPAATAPKLMVKLAPATDSQDDSRNLAPYRVRLFFALPPGEKPTRRVFDVMLQGNRILPALTLDPQAGPPGTSLIHTIERIELPDSLHLQLIPREGLPVISGLSLEALPQP